MSKPSSLHNRMKQYELRSVSYVPRRTYVLVRIDGKRFSKYTKKLNKPFDDKFKNAMIVTAIELCKEFHPKMAYYQSDEITLIFTDFDNIETQQIYDGEIQKIVSITASCATAAFNQMRLLQAMEECSKESQYLHNLVVPKPGMFDSRVFCIPDREEVLNSLIWRQKDATRNSISMAAHTILGHSACMNLSGDEKQEAMFQKGVNWNDYADVFKRGVVIAKVEETKEGGAVRNVWKPVETPIFTQDREFLYNLIPKLG